MSVIPSRRSHVLSRGSDILPRASTAKLYTNRASAATIVMNTIFDVNRVTPSIGKKNIGVIVNNTNNSPYPKVSILQFTRDEIPRANEKIFVEILLNIYSVVYT